MSALPKATAVSSTSTLSSNQNHAFTLASTTAGDLNIIPVGGLVSGTNQEINTLSIPAGWTLSIVDTDSNARTGTSASWVGLLWKVRAADDVGSTVLVDWATQTGNATAPTTGQAASPAIAIAAGNFDPTDPLPYAVTAELPGSTTAYTVAGTTPAGKDGVLYFGATARTDATAWTSSDGTLVEKTQVGVAGGTNASIVVRHAGNTAGGTAFSKSHTGPSTSIGMAFAFLVRNAPGVPAVTPVNPNSRGAARRIVGPWVTRTGRKIDEWLRAGLRHVAHRGSSSDYVEMSADAYASAAARNWDLGLEFSTWRTADGFWVGSHDQTTTRMFGTNKDIPTSNWVGDLQNLRTTTGSKPLMLLTDFLALYGGGKRILFIDNKSGTNNSAFLDLLDANGGPDSIVVKAFNTSTSLFVAARARGYRTWGFFYDADAATITDAQVQNIDILGMDATGGTAGASIWAKITEYKPRPVLSHIVDSPAQLAAGAGWGADGAMVSRVSTVTPYAALEVAPASRGPARTVGAPVVSPTGHATLSPAARGPQRVVGAPASLPTGYATITPNTRAAARVVDSSGLGVIRAPIELHYSLVENGIEVPLTLEGVVQGGVVVPVTADITG